MEQLIALARTDNPQAKRINAAVFGYAESRRGQIRKLEGYDDRWRLRVGNWRVIFRQDTDSVHVLEVVLRRDAY
jgi:mRNA interferase RelE/StbE